MANKGLGRGLGSLLGILDDENETQTHVEDKASHIHGEEVVELSMGLIDVNPNQPRKNFDPTALNELTSSIRRRYLQRDFRGEGNTHRDY